MRARAPQCRFVDHLRDWARGCRHALEALVFTERTTIGLDVHARSVRAAALDTVTGELREAKLGGGTGEAVEWVLAAQRDFGIAAVAYEAGPTGFGLARALEQAGVRCVVAAPSKIRRAAGDRVKTDAKDAVLLARMLRMDELTAVRVPTIAQESARDLVRAREDARIELMAARHRLSKLLLRHGLVYDGDAWTGRHDAWLRRLRVDGLDGAGAGTVAAFDAAYDTVAMTLARRDRLDEQIEQMAADSQFSDVTRRLACLRGISTLTGFALAVEIGDWDRFTGANIASYLGLVPSEHSSGQKRSQGGITRTGNQHVRRLLVESAWHHKRDYRVGRTMTERWKLAPPAVVARADAGNRRLNRRWQVMTARNKRHAVANAAIARELSGWCWSLATMDA